MFAQTLNKPIPADNPNYAGNDPWVAACASSGFDEYFVNFTWNTPLVDSDNEFILELSDASGDFTSPIELDKVGNKNLEFDFEFDFILPTNTKGENYRFRVRSTKPALTSPVSDPFPMYYVDFNTGPLVSKDGNGTIPSGGKIEICDGNSVTLAVHNVPNANTYQYNWYRSGTLLTSEKEFSITISTAGIYSVQIDYGAICSGALPLSNYVEITTGTSLGIAINTPSKTALCTGETVTLDANITGQGLTYTWYKDNVAITTPTVDDTTYTVDASNANFAGDYTVEIDDSSVCLERSAIVTIGSAGTYTVTRVNDANIVVLPSQTKNLSITTTATGPTYQWYKDGSAISGATNNALDVTDAGNYYAQITQGGGSCTTTINSDTTIVTVPASFEIIVDYTTTYTSCVSTTIALGVTTINAIAADNSKTDVTSAILADFTFQWKKDGTVISGATSNTINLSSITDNGNYSLDGVLTSYNDASNVLAVQLLTNETLTITSTSLTYCTSTTPIKISTPTNLTSETIKWLKDGVSINTTDTELTITETGTYQLVLTKNGCDLESNVVIITPLEESLINLNTPNNTVIIPEGTSKTITATGGTSYRWYTADNTLISDTDSASFTEEGAYILIANIDACEVSKNITVTYLDTFKVPNVITLNADGINDLWVLPNSYSNDSEVTVTIYNTNGKEIFNVTDYKNNWPESSMVFPKQNMVFYYKIQNTKEVLKQGTITIIR